MGRRPYVSPTSRIPPQITPVSLPELFTIFEPSSGGAFGAILKWPLQCRSTNHGANGATTADRPCILSVPGAVAGFRVRGGAQVAYPGFQRGGCLRSGPIQKVGGGGGGGRFRSDIRKGGGGRASGPIYEKWGGGGGRFRLDIRKVGGGGGGGGGALQVRYTKSGGVGHSASGPIPLGTQKIPTYVLPRYTSHARANERKIYAGKG